MVVIITTKNATEIAPHEFATEVSEIGSPDGFPMVLQTTLGNGLDFVFDRKIWGDGEFLGARYKQQFGCVVLTVFND